MNIDPKTNLQKQRRKAMIWCLVISPCVVLLLNSWYWLIEILRVDNYGYGAKFYLVIILSGLLCNGIIVKSVYKSADKDEKIRLWMKASLIAFFVIIGLSLLISGLFFLAFLFGPKMGG